jgi:small subunit ribosomal protein S8
MTDPISDMLTRIRNALAVKKREVFLPYSNLKYNLAISLQKHGWLEEVGTVEAEKGRKTLKLSLKYESGGQASISGIKRISKQGQRIYARVSEIPKLQVSGGTVILSTPKGLLTSREARKEKVGGEVICEIW